MADNIESLDFTYYDVNGNETEIPAEIRMVKITVVAKTNLADPEYKGGDGYRRRTLSSRIKPRNMGLKAVWPTGGKN